MQRKQLELRLTKQLEDNMKMGWSVSVETDLAQLISDMLICIGSPNPYLRDELIYESFFQIVKNHHVAAEKMKELLFELVSEDYLFCDIKNPQENDNVFKRTFSILVITVILDENNKQQFLSKSEFDNTFDKILKYLYAETDLRGYVLIKGWAHSVAHTADALCSLAVCKYFDRQKSELLLSAIKDKIHVYYYTYIHNEDERLINVVVEILKRSLLSEEYIKEWILSLADVKKLNLFPQDGHLFANCKLFLQSLYFRMKTDYPIYAETAEQALKMLYTLKLYNHS